MISIQEINVTVLEGGYNLWYLSYAPLCLGKWTSKNKPSATNSNMSGGPDSQDFNTGLWNTIIDNESSLWLWSN